MIRGWPAISGASTSSKPRRPASRPRRVEARAAKAPIDGVITRVHVAVLVDVYARIILPAAHAVGLQDDLPGGREALAQHAQQRQRRLDAVQDAKAEDDVERLPEATDLERVQPAIGHARAQKLGDRPEPGTGLKVDSEPATDPGDVLLVVHGHHPGGPATLGQEGVETVERAHVEHARAGELLGYRAQAVAVIARDARRVDTGAVERERVKPQRHALQRGARLLPPGVDRQQVRHSPLRGGDLGDRLQIFRRHCHSLG